MLMMNNIAFGTSIVNLAAAMLAALTGWFFYSSKTGSRAVFLAGYNMATEEERSLYDEKALCKYTGKQFFFMALLLLIGAVLGFILFLAGVDSDSIIAWGGVFVGWGGFMVIFVYYTYVRYRKMDMFLKQNDNK